MDTEPDVDTAMDDEVCEEEEVVREVPNPVERLPEVSKLRRSHTLQRKRLSLTRQPFETLRLAALSLSNQSRNLWIHVLRHHLRVVAAGVLTVLTIVALAVVDGPHEYYVREAMAHFRFALWWIGLGVASSIGLGAGLHTFVMFLAPHIVMFTLRASRCGRVDFKQVAYDTRQWWGIPASWELKECLELGEPMFPRLATDGLESYVVPIVKVVLQVQLEVILWGIGTAIGELPPYFISRAARLSGEKVKELEDLVNLPEARQRPSLYARLKVWGFRRFSHLGFFAILVFASVPNPVFDLAGLMCGYLLVPFWKFFLATLIGKAIVKTHLQTLSVIFACNPHVMEALLVGMEWVMSHIPFLNRWTPQIMAAVRAEIHKLSGNAGLAEAVKGGGFSVGALWTVLLQLMMAGFVASIITASAQGCLMEQQKQEMAALVARLTRKKTKQQPQPQPQQQQPQQHQQQQEEQPQQQDEEIKEKKER